jgi:hypothetical protein
MSVLSLFQRDALAQPDRLATVRSEAAAARRALIEERSTLERSESFVRLRDDLARKASDTTRSANDFRNNWVRAGCPFSGTRELQRLDDDAAVATAEAQRASVNATAVIRELPRAESAVRSAERAIKECEEKVGYEIDLILVSEFDETVGLARGEQLAAEYQAWRIQARGLHNIVRGAEANRLLQSAVDHASSQIKHIEEYSVSPQGFVVGAPQADVLAVAAKGRARAARLREDPNA